MKKGTAAPGYLVAIVITITLIVGFQYDMRSSPVGGCGNGDFSDQSVAASRGIPVEVLESLRTQRSLTNEDICVMPQDKLDRALYRVENPKPDHPGEAAQFRMMQNQDENGEIPEDAIPKALAHIETMPVAPLTSRPSIEPEEFRPSNGDGPSFMQEGAADLEPSDWTWKGPGNIGGRVRAIVIHPTQPDRMWAGAVSGGIWYTQDGGASWAPVDDFMMNLAVSTLIMDPTDSNIMFAGTGEGFYNIDSIRGAGVFKSTDGGVNWSQLSSTASSDWHWVNRLAISPNGDTLLAATNSGIYRSTNGGINWTQVHTNRILDVDFHPTDNNKAVAGGSFLKAYYSTDGGLTWTQTSGLPSSIDLLARVEVAYAPSNGDYVYASLNLNSGEVWRSTDGGQSYSLQNTGQSYLGNQGWYDNVVWVDPTDPDTVVLGGIDLWRSTDGSTNLGRISHFFFPSSAHVDHHAIVEHPDFDGSTNKTVFFGNDGGVYKTEDVYTIGPLLPPNGWIELNNQLGITQFYGAAGNVTSEVIIGGTQDNGTLRFAGDTEGWTMMLGGDGGFCASDPTDPDYFYTEYVFLMIYRSTDAGMSASAIYEGLADAENQEANFIAPYILDPNDPDALLAGGKSLWRSSNVKADPPTWGVIKSSVGSYISAIAVAQGDSDLIWVGHNNGAVYHTANGSDPNPTWTRVDGNSPGLPNRYIHRITIDPTDHNRVYVTFGGYEADNVYKTPDNGATWVDITGSGATGLPDVPVRSLVIHPDDDQKIYVGTEIGIYASVDGGTNWSIPQDGPANVSVDELFWMDRTLVAATHGRGIYEVDLDEGVEIIDAWTADGSWNPKAVFQLGDTVQWVITVQNNSDVAESVQLTFDVRDPLGGQAFYWQGNVTAPVGLSNWGYSDTVSEPNGVYTFDAGADYQGRVTVDSASYQVPSIVFIPLVIR